MVAQLSSLATTLGFFALRMKEATRRLTSCPFCPSISLSLFHQELHDLWDISLDDRRGSLAAIRVATALNCSRITAGRLRLAWQRLPFVVDRNWNLLVVLIHGISEPCTRFVCQLRPFCDTSRRGRVQGKYVWTTTWSFSKMPSVSMLILRFLPAA